MGLLDALKQYVSDSMPGGLLNPEWNKANGQRLAEELNRGLLESTGINARDKRRVWERNKLDAVSGSSDTKASLNQQAYDSALAMAGMAPMGLTVWHGSPHKFSKFDMSKIGTGEGAQAYGHGLYMAESPDVAKSYSGKLSSELSYNGKPMNRDSSSKSKDAAAWALYLANGDKEIAKGSGLALPEVIDKLDPKKLKAGGQTYKVDIPDEAVSRMLDWDKPINQQAPEVQKAWAALKDRVIPSSRGGETTIAKELPESPTGYDLMYALKKLDPETYYGPKYGSAPSSMLNEFGIPGIKYADAGSRWGSPGQGTSNYVLFSDQLPRILEVNGKPTGQTPWAAGEWQGLLSQ